MIASVESHSKLGAALYESGAVTVSTTHDGDVNLQLESRGPQPRQLQIRLTPEDAANLGDLLRAAARDGRRRSKP